MPPGPPSMPHDCLSGSSPVEHLGARPSLLGAQKGGPWREMQSAMGARITGPVASDIPLSSGLGLRLVAGMWGQGCGWVWCSRVEWS